MKRKTFDKILTTIGFGIAIFLIVTAGLLNWGSTFAKSSVSDQLEAQQIVMPASTGNPNEDSEVTEFFKDNGGEMMSNAKQAEMYAKHLIGYDLSQLPTYAQAVTARATAEKALAQFPDNQKIVDDAKKKAADVETIFKGTILQGTLLTAYAFGTLGGIAGIAALVSLVIGLLILILSFWGLAHLRRVPEEAMI